MMLRSLLIGVNGTPGSRQAIELGLGWAHNLKIPVTCLGVVDTKAIAPFDPGLFEMPGYKADRDAHLISTACKQVEDAIFDAARQAEKLGVECHVRVVQGNPAVELGQEAQRHDLLVVGRRRMPESSRELPASTTMTDILRLGPRPVVVASREIPAASPVMLAYDGSPQAARTLASFLSSGLYYGHPLHLVGVSDDPATMQTVLGRAVDYLAAHGQQATVHVLPVGAGIAESLTQFAHNLPASLMVMGVYGEPRLKEMLFGSVTRTILNTTPVPLFLDC